MSVIVTTLGTSSGVPTKQRNVSAAVVQASDSKDWWLIDCGEATQQQLLRTQLSLRHLRGICITHIHGDHCYGLPGLLASIAMNGRTDPLTIIAPQAIEQWLQATIDLTELRLTYSWSFYAAETLPEVNFDIMTVKTFPLSHRVPSHAYQFTQELTHTELNSEKLLSDGVPKGPLWGKIQRGENVQVGDREFLSEEYVTTSTAVLRAVICGDNDNPELLWDACEDCHLLLHEATYHNAFADKAQEYGHSYAEQVARFAEQRKLPHLVLTHFSSRYSAQSGPHSVATLRKEAQAHFSGQLDLASDFDRFEVKA